MKKTVPVLQAVHFFYLTKGSLPENSLENFHSKLRNSFEQKYFTEIEAYRYTDE